MMIAHDTPRALNPSQDRILRPRELAGCVGWRTSDIEAWLTARTERRERGTAEHPE